MTRVLKSDVLISGGGPCGLMLANELGRRNIRCLLVDPKPGTAFNPQANATQARTMEHYRRLGFAQEIRSMGLPPDHPTDIAYLTRFAGTELARLRLPTAAAAPQAIKAMSGSWSAAELPHRVSQKFVEVKLREQAQRLPSVDVRYGCLLKSFADTGSGIEAVVQAVDGGEPLTVQSAYLVGADGARSFVRKQLGLELCVVPHASAELAGPYQAPLVLIRPDQIVAWRGHTSALASEVLAQVTGRS